MWSTTKPWKNRDRIETGYFNNKSNNNNSITKIQYTDNLVTRCGAAARPCNMLKYIESEYHDALRAPG
jgi:hypothetical protein